MNWTPENAAAAAQEGWGVFDVVEHGAGKLTVQVLQIDARFSSPRAAQLFVIERARLGSKLHVQALRAVVAGHAPRKRTKAR